MATPHGLKCFGCGSDLTGPNVFVRKDHKGQAAPLLGSYCSEECGEAAIAKERAGVLTLDHMLGMIAFCIPSAPSPPAPTTAPS